MSHQTPGTVTPAPSAPSQLIQRWISSVCPPTGHLDLHMWSRYLSSQTESSPWLLTCPWPLTSRLRVGWWIRGVLSIVHDSLTDSRTWILCPLRLPLLPLGQPRWRPAVWGVSRTRGTLRTPNPASTTCWAASHVSTTSDLWDETVGFKFFWYYRWFIAGSSESKICGPCREIFTGPQDPHRPVENFQPAETRS